MSLEETLNAYGDMVYRVALTHTQRREDAEDAVQDVFVIYARRQPVFTDETHARAWFLRVTIRRCGQIRASAWNRRTRALPENLPENARDGSDVYLAFLSLKPLYKTPVYLFYYERFSVRQIARLLSVSEAAVKKRLERARVTLREILGGDFDEKP